MQATTTTLRTLSHWIGGRSAEGGERTGDVYDPATGQVQARVAFANAETVDLAVGAAADAADEWSRTTTPKRVRVLHNFLDQLTERESELAGLLTSEQGKTGVDAGAELMRMRESIELACSAVLALKGDYSQRIATGIDVFSIKEPVGVCVGVTPFNFPALAAALIFPTALAAGNTFVLKPSEKDPSTTLVIAEMLKDSGLPDGVFNVLQGDAETVNALLDHPDVAAVSFIGSTPAAEAVYTRAAAAGKRVQALGGGKNHMVVMPDADLDKAADAMVSGAYGSSGQRCMAVTTVVAVGDIGDELVRRAVERAARMVVGPGADEQSDIGPITTPQAYERILGLIERGEATGAELALDGRSAGADVPGFFIGPCLFDRVTPEMELYREEIFGPVLIVVRVATLEDALDLIRSNPYGNGSSIFTSSGATAQRFRERTTTGGVGINVPIPVPLSYYPLGGWKASRFGVHGVNFGGFEFFTRRQTTTVRWEAVADGVDFAFPTNN